MLGLRGVTGEDVTSALNGILSTGRDIYIDPTSGEYTISGELRPQSDQRVYGAGRKSRIRQTKPDLNVITVLSKSGTVLEDLNLRCVGSISAIANGGGVYANSCDDIRVSRVGVNGHRGAGVNLYRTTNSLVEDCLFTGSVVQAGESNSQALADITLVYGSSGNEVRGNRCKSGNGSGIVSVVLRPRP